MMDTNGFEIIFEKLASSSLDAEIVSQTFYAEADAIAEVVRLSESVDDPEPSYSSAA